MSAFKTIAAAIAFTVLLIAPALAANHAVTIQGMKFSPASISLKAGDTITFTNKDSSAHTATAKDGSFDTGRLRKGQSKTVTVSHAGTIAYICSIHPSMKGTVKAK